jgi:L-gulonate 5-dehydrogenase
MKAVVVAEPEILNIEERPMPSAPTGTEAVVRIKAAGICGTDSGIYLGRSAFATYPRIIGHEMAGEVYQTGSLVTVLKPGDRVAIDPVVSCGSCYACRIGRRNVCRNVKVLGVHLDGGYSEYIKVDAGNIYKLPDNIPWEFAATVEPFSIAAESIERGRLKPEDSVLICGAGPIGLVILQAVKRIGAHAIIMDMIDSRLEKALGMGADLAVNSKKNDITKVVMDFTGGEGANIIFEATGNLSILELCISKLVSQAGRIVVLGFPAEPAKIAPIDIMKRELDIVGSRLNRNKFSEVIQWLKSNEVDPSKIISHIFPVDKIQEAFDLSDKEPEKVCKIILTF